MEISEQHGAREIDQSLGSRQKCGKGLTILKRKIHKPRKVNQV